MAAVEARSCLRCIIECEAVLPALQGLGQPIHVRSCRLLLAKHPWRPELLRSRRGALQPRLVLVLPWPAVCARFPGLLRNRWQSPHPSPLVARRFLV